MDLSARCCRRSPLRRRHDKRRPRLWSAPGEKRSRRVAYWCWIGEHVGAAAAAGRCLSLTSSTSPSMRSSSTALAVLPASFLCAASPPRHWGRRCAAQPIPVVSAPLSLPPQRGLPASSTPRQPAPWTPLSPRSRERGRGGSRSVSPAEVPGSLIAVRVRREGASRVHLSRCRSLHFVGEV